MLSLIRRGLAAASGLTMAIASLTACSPSSSPHDLMVVATTTQICGYVTQIAARSVDISLDETDAAGKNSRVGATPDGAAFTMSLTRLFVPNVSAHEHEMTLAQTKVLLEANVTAVSGVDLEHFLDDVVVSLGFKGRMVATSGVLTAADIDNPGAADEQGAYTIDHRSERVDVVPWLFPSEEAGKEPEFRFDPHVWIPPEDAHAQVANLGADLAAAVSEAASLINVVAAPYLEDIDVLDQWIAEAIGTVPAGQRMLLTSHDVFGYFSRDCGICFIGAALPDFNEQQDATADHIAKAVVAVKESGAVALFAENPNNFKSIEAIARAVGVTSIVGKDAVHDDSLGPDGSGGATYVGSIVHNARAATQVWSGTVPDLPERLRDQ